jgi:hypothetical protein
VPREKCGTQPALRERGFYWVSSPFKGEVRRGMGLSVGVVLIDDVEFGRLFAEI